MENYTFRKRNKLDIILTDSRPVELPSIFTLKYLYEYLNNDSEFMKLAKKAKADGVTYYAGSKKRDTVINSSWHAVPLKYHVYKNKDHMRELSVLNPLSLMEIYIFVSMYEKMLLEYSSGGGFSIRKRKVYDNLKFKKIEEQLVVYTENEKQLVSLEGSGQYFKVGPYKKITDFYKSEEWYQLNSSYSFCGKIDYSSCFHSIYTHTYSWIVTRNSVDGKNYSQNNQYFLNDCDTVMQNINASVTNGIVVGPEFSRMMADIIMQYIDEMVRDKAKVLGIEEKVHYYVCRFVDDIFIFADNLEVVDKIIKIYEEEAERFHLRINEEKLEKHQLPTIWFPWKQEIVLVKQYVIDTLFAKKNKVDYLVAINNEMLSNMKELYQNLIASFPENGNTIASYVLSVLYNKFSEYAKKKIFKNDRIESDSKKIIKLLFFFYSYAPTYVNTERVISILRILRGAIPGNIFKAGVEQAIHMYYRIFCSGNMEDIVDLILVLASLKIELPRMVEIEIEKTLIKKNNPMLYAVWLLYSAYDEKYNKNIAEKIEVCIVNAIDQMYDEKKFFMYQESWWIYIFIGCPFLQQTVLDKIIKYLNTAKGSYNGDDVVDVCKDRVFKFLLRSQKKGTRRFIEWDLSSEILLEKIEFSTYERMIFKGQQFLKDNFDDRFYD